MMRYRWLIIAAIVGLGWPFSQATIAQTPTVEVGRAVFGSIGPNEVQAWTLIAPAEGPLVVLVQQLDGDLDPQVNVALADGTLIVENDDVVAGIIADAAVTYEAEAGISYIITVQPFAGSGNYQLLVLPTIHQLVWDVDDFSQNVVRWASPYTRQIDQQLVFETGRLIDRSIVLAPTGQMPIRDGYLHVEFAWRTTEPSTTFGVVLRTTSEDFTPDGYYFNLNPNGRWEIVQQLANQPIILADGVLDTLPDTPTLGATATGDELIFFVGGQMVASLTDIAFDAGGWGLHLRGDGQPAGVAIKRLLLLTPLIEPPPAPVTLENWRSARADDIAAELAGADTIAPNGRRVYTVLDTNYQIGAQSTRTYPQVPEGASYGDMLLSVDVLATEGDDVACGVSVRDIGNADRVLVYGGVNGDAGVIIVRSGEVYAHTYDILAPSDEPLAGGATRLTLILQGPYVLVYINGRYFTTQYSPPTSGAMGVVLLNYADDSGRCAFRNLWIWQ